MTLAVHKIAVLDSSTLGIVARDYWSKEGAARDKSRRFLAELVERGVFIAFTLTHVSELLAHGNPDVVQDRLRFLRSIKLIAWLRPYNREWFPGSIYNLLTRELHSAVHDSAGSWEDIIQKVRPGLWETGTGSDMFIEDDQLWSAIQIEARRNSQHEVFTASVARTRPLGNKDIKLGDLLNLPRRPKEEWQSYTERFSKEIKRQLERHGDRRLHHTGLVAGAFANNALGDVLEIEAMGGDWTQSMLEFLGIPSKLVGPETTVGEIGELAIYAKRLGLIAGHLNPRLKVDMLDVPPDTLPSYVLERRLSLLQDKADRVSGSDFGDSFIAPLVFYSDGVVVDKRTFNHMKAIRLGDSNLANLMCPFFRSSDYMDIPQHFDRE